MVVAAEVMYGGHIMNAHKNVVKSSKIVEFLDLKVMTCSDYTLQNIANYGCNQLKELDRLMISFIC